MIHGVQGLEAYTLQKWSMIRSCPPGSCLHRCRPFKSQYAAKSPTPNGVGLFASLAHFIYRSHEHYYDPDVPPSTPVPGAFGGTWTFPRPKKHATGMFLTLAALRPAFQVLVPLPEKAECFRTRLFLKLVTDLNTSCTPLPTFH